MKLEPICKNTLMKYIERLTGAVEAKISQNLAEKFPLVLDGWTLKGTSTHYVCLLSHTLGNVCTVWTSVILIVLGSRLPWVFSASRRDRVHGGESFRIS